MTVTLVQPYDRAWPSYFERIKAFLESGAGDVGCMIEHVGSTAIPGMTAKPIIDVDIVAEQGAFAAIKERLEALGYTHQGDLGLLGREAFDLVDAGSKATLPAHHLYVCERGVHELRKHLAFRDFMRQHAEWRERLSRLKRELCVKHKNDRQAYMDGKAKMVEEITKLAIEDSEHVHGQGLEAPNGAPTVTSEASHVLTVHVDCDPIIPECGYRCGRCLREMRSVIEGMQGVSKLYVEGHGEDARVVIEYDACAVTGDQLMRALRGLPSFYKGFFVPALLET